MFMLRIALFMSCLAAAAFGLSTPYSLQSMDGRWKRGEPRPSSSYITYLAGGLPLILSAPHGGYDKPGHIPDRDAGCWDGNACLFRHSCTDKDLDRCEVSSHQDYHTRELTLLVRDKLHALYGKYPHVIINELHRSKLDANRDLDEATFGEPEAVEAWKTYHLYINQSKEDIGGPGLFIDMHGHGHATQWAELGYLISGSDLDNDNIDPEASSIRNLAGRAGISFDQLLRGEKSFGSFLQKGNFMSVPSADHPKPEGREYYNGGYNTRKHGSRYGGVIDAIQIESASTFRYNETMDPYSSALTEALKSYLETYYQVKPEATSSAVSAFFCINTKPLLIFLCVSFEFYLK